MRVRVANGFFFIRPPLVIHPRKSPQCVIELQDRVFYVVIGLIDAKSDEDRKIGGAQQEGLK